MSVSYMYRGSRRYLRLILVFCVCLLSSHIFNTTIHAAGLIDNEQDLSSGTNWGTLYNTATGDSGTGDNFGAYVFEAIGSDLYIGLATARPAEENGALLVKWNGTTATASGELDEQGFASMSTADNSALVIPGSDPTDDWTYGNMYTFDGTTFTKYRATSGLSDVFHLFDVTKKDDGTLFAGGGIHDGSQPDTCILGTSCMGAVYTSTNNGQSWTKTSNLGNYRVYGLGYTNSKLYAIVNNDTTYNDLYVSTNDGSNWTALTTDKTIMRSSPVAHNGELVVLAGSSSANRLISVDADGTLTTHNLSFRIGYAYAEASYANYNQMFSVEGYLYVITSDGGVKRSYDLDHWETISESASTYISIGYWPQEHWLLVGERGNGARIRYIDLDSFTSVSATNLDASLDLVDPHTDRDLTVGSSFNYGTYKTARVQTDDGLVVSDVVIDMSSSRSWTGVAADSNGTTGKAYIKDVEDVSGAAATHTLYIPIPITSDGTDVIICPDAESLAEVTVSCSSGVRFQEDEEAEVGGVDVTVTKITIDSQEYWKAEGVGGTGGIDTTPDVSEPSVETIEPASSLTQKISWTTNEASSSQVEYGLTESLGTTTTEANTSPRVTSHIVILRGLNECTTYYYKVHSSDASSNTYSSALQSFTSYGC